MLSFLSFSFFQSKAFLQTAASLAPHMYEPHFNLSILSEKVTNSLLVLYLPVSLLHLCCTMNWCFLAVQIGDLQSSYTAAQKSEDSFPEHVDTQQLLKQLREHFSVL